MGESLAKRQGKEKGRRQDGGGDERGRERKPPIIGCHEEVVERRVRRKWTKPKPAAGCVRNNNLCALSFDSDSFEWDTTLPTTHVTRNNNLK